MYLHLLQKYYPFLKPEKFQTYLYTNSNPDLQGRNLKSHHTISWKFSQTQQGLQYLALFPFRWTLKLGLLWWQCYFVTLPLKTGILGVCCWRRIRMWNKHVKQKNFFFFLDSILLMWEFGDQIFVIFFSEDPKLFPPPTWLYQTESQLLRTNLILQGKEILIRMLEVYCRLLCTLNSSFKPVLKLD